MAYEISMNSNGQAEAMYAYTPAWHGLGSVIQREVRPLEALKIAGLEWAVRKETLYRTNLDSIPDRVAISRTDNGRYLGTVGLNYTPIQNLDVASFIESLCGEGNAAVETCGALRGGRRTFWSIRLPNALTIGINDTVDRFLIVANSHDGSLAFRAFWSPVRVVCSNTLNAALRRSKSGMSLRHTGSITARIKEAKYILGLASEYYAEVGERFQALADVTLDDNGFDSFQSDVLPAPNGTEVPEAVLCARQSIANNWRSGRGTETTAKTFWRAYNSVTEFSSHQRTTRGKSAVVQAENRFDAVLFGAGRMLQQRAFDTAVRMSGLN